MVNNVNNVKANIRLYLI